MKPSQGYFDFRDINNNLFCPKSVVVQLKQTHLKSSVLSLDEPGTHLGLRGSKKLRVFHVTHVPNIDERFDDGSIFTKDIGEDRIVGFRKFPLFKWHDSRGHFRNAFG
jgi:hypothetical protein